jgi:signal transduction histidine kinase
VRRRVLRAIVGSVAVTLIVFGLPLAWVIGQAYRDDLSLRLTSAALAAAPELTDADARLQPPEPPQQRAGVRLAYYDAAGRFMAGRGPQRADAVVRAALRGQNGLAERVVAVPVSRDEQVIGVVRAEEDPGLLAARIHGAWLLMGALAIGILAAASGIAIALARRLTAPVHTLAEAARRLEGGDFAVAPPPTGIPELDTAGQALAAAAERLEGVLARERALTADVTHQLKTPLTALRLELEAGADRPRGPDVGRSLTEVDRLEATIASILALARDTEATREPVALEPVVSAAARAWLGAAQRKGRSIVVERPARPVVARVSPHALRQILDVLIDNAIAHGRGRVSVTVRDAAGSAEILVGDEGETSLDSAQIFARRSPSLNGHGIGLALARSLVEAEGGRLTLASDEPTTTFSLLLRSGAEEVIEAPPPAEPPL